MKINGTPDSKDSAVNGPNMPAKFRRFCVFGVGPEREMVVLNQTGWLIYTKLRAPASAACGS
jgi:hypothetical protein